VLTIIEVISRAKQGQTKPFLCRANDGNLYYVKGKSAGRLSLINEWLAANLAKAFGLPVPDFAVATVPEELLKDVADANDLGFGEVFASKRVLASDLTEAQIALVDEHLRQDVVMFDWWIENVDRTLTGISGNVNLLYGAAGLVVIDHNLGFDFQWSLNTLNQQAFRHTHVFRNELPKLQDKQIKHQYQQRFEKALVEWDAWVSGIPEAWNFVDIEMTMQVDYPKNQVRKRLDRHLDPDDSFWDF
jgi:hypothetical protein